MAHASLSAYTANTIQGTPPALSFDGTTPATNLDGLLGFSMLDKDGQSVYIKADQATPVEASKNNTFNSFTVESDLSKYYYDADGDTKHATTPVAGTITKTWTYIGSDGSTKTVSSSELANPLNACNAPYTLTIVASGIQVQSAYGDPAISSVYADASKTYTIDVADYKYCFAKPNSMRWVDATKGSLTSSGGSSIVVGRGGGYDGNNFDPVKGFKADASPTFPTTGFANAQFQLIMSKGQSFYEFKSSDTIAADVGLSSGNVTLKEKPSAPITITATPKVAGYPVVSYTFDPRTVWAEPQTVGKVLFSAVNCPNGLLTRKDLSNSLQNNVNKPNATNYFTRAIGGGVLGEWGESIIYSGANWETGTYWTSDKQSVTNLPFIVGSRIGSIGVGEATSSFYVVCKG